MSENTAVFRFAIMGAGKIAHKFTRAVQLVEGAQVCAVASKSAERAAAFAEAEGIAASYDSYEAMLLQEKPDCVYIATTADAHFPLTMLCLRHGVGVLCEKAMFLSLKEAEEAIRTAREKGVFLMEALWTRFLPPIREARRWVREGLIGKPVMGDMGVGFIAPSDPSNRYFSPKLGGGAAYDLTVYCMEVLSWVLDRKAVRMQAEAVSGETGVDVTEVALVRFEDDILAVLRSSFMAPVEERMVICGTKGKIVVPRAHYMPEAYLYNEKGEEVRRFVDEETVNGFTYEAEAAMRCIREGRVECDVVPHSATLECAKLFDLIQASMVRP